MANMERGLFNRKRGSTHHSFNGKARFQMTFPIDASKEDVETAALND